MNLEGGHRRLNVAVSRARQEVVIFSTLLPEQIDLARVRAAGVRDLKNYLEFALRGPRALVEQSLPTGREPDSPFETEVIRALREKGWTAHPQVGVSGYRIDIGIVDPRAPGRYLLGVECDGRSYHSAATARDRDRLRQHILEGLGWQLHRIWSTDWWLNPQAPLGRLLQNLESLLAAVPAEAPASNTTESETEGAPVGTEAEVYAKLVEPVAPAPTALTEYRPTTPNGGSPEVFYESPSTAELRRQLVEVIDAEGPIDEAALFRRLARAWNLARTGKRIEERLRNLIPSHISMSREQAAVFYWPTGISPIDWDRFRVAGTDPSSRRPIEDICLEEIGNLALFLLSEHGATTLDDLARSVCRLFGISRTSGEAEARVRQALAVGRAGKLVDVTDAIVSIRRA